VIFIPICILLKKGLSLPMTIMYPSVGAASGIIILIWAKEMGKDKGDKMVKGES